MASGAQASPKSKLRRKVTEYDPEETASQRLVEYFVVVSSHPRWESQKPSTEQKRKTTRRRQKGSDAVDDATDIHGNARDTSRRRRYNEPAVAGDVVVEKNESTEEKDQTTGNIHMPQDHAEHTFQPKITARYPTLDHEDHILNPMIVQFCYPHSDVIFPSTEFVMPRVHHFVLTNDKGTKIYGTCLTVYEEYLPGKDAPIHRDLVHSASDLGDIEVTPDAQGSALYLPKVLCVLSTWPYLTSFREYLTQLYRLATATDMMTTPIERYVINLCREIPAPPPGAFEIQVSILTSTIRFWAPPAKLPMAYVALPYETLFACLDLENILTVWYALTLERKVLLLSSQYSILTVCAEILCSLLFPFTWSHLYVPLLPKFLSPMLDAPVPYLVGVIRDNWMLAQEHVNEETIVVDLDRNTVTLGEQTEALPPPPSKKYSKLQSSLEQETGEIYWKTRGVWEEHRKFVHKKPDPMAWEKARREGDKRWSEKLNNYDEAISVAYSPESLNLDTVNEHDQSRWDRVQETFLRFFVSTLKDYRKFLSDIDSDSPDSVYNQWRSRRTFDRELFVASQRAEYQPFLSELSMTQQFDGFLTKRIYSPGEPDVKFFDQSIDAKKNRSKLKVNKVETPFLQSAQAHKVLKIVQAVPPSSEGLSYGDPFVYEKWPETFDKSKFYMPRSIPRIITSEFDRQAALVTRLRAHHTIEDEVQDHGELFIGNFDSSPEVATFTVFFITYSAVIGRDWQKFVENRREREIMGYATSEDEEEYLEALAVAAAQLDLGFNVLSMMQMRGLSPDPEAIKCLMEACGRCGDAERAKKLLEILSSDGLVADSEMYSNFLSAFTYGEGTGIETPASVTRRGSDAYSVFLKKKLEASTYKPEDAMPSTIPASDTSDELSSNGDTAAESMKHATQPESGASSWTVVCGDFLSFLHVGWTATPQARSPGKAKKKRQRRKSAFDGLVVTSQVKKQVALGENLLDVLYPDLQIDSQSDACPMCSRVLLENEVVAGWQSRQFSDFTTGCPECKHRFVPRFTVRCSDPAFEGSQGPGTPLYCEFLSPWVLIKELKQEVHSWEAVEAMLNPKWRHGTDINATLWWNLAISFIRYRLPVSFLLQGSFQNRLINPDPEC